MDRLGIRVKYSGAPQRDILFIRDFGVTPEHFCMVVQNEAIGNWACVTSDFVREVNGPFPADKWEELYSTPLNPHEDDTLIVTQDIVESKLFWWMIPNKGDKFAMASLNGGDERVLYERRGVSRHAFWATVAMELLRRLNDGFDEIDYLAALDLEPSVFSARSMVGEEPVAEGYDRRVVVNADLVEAVLNVQKQ